jgi:hypothetical protein
VLVSVTAVRDLLQDAVERVTLERVAEFEIVVEHCVRSA